MPDRVPYGHGSSGSAQRLSLSSRPDTSRDAPLPTYYGRPQLKPAPFNKAVVGAYIFLAGLSGAAALLAAVADRESGINAKGVARRGRYLSLLTMTAGPVLLIYDLHTPKRFYNMLRIAKGTSPMSIGTWNLVAFSTFAGVSAVGQFVSDRVPAFRWLNPVARASQVPAAIAGAGLSTYTASLLSATSTPSWAVAPEALAIRFGASSIAAGAAALNLGERSEAMRNRLEAVTGTALAVEAVATLASAKAHRDRGLAKMPSTPSRLLERAGAIGVGVALPLGLYALSRLAGGDKRVSNTASMAVLAGSLLLRISTLGVGADSAKNPDVSLRFSQPSNTQGRD
jgi:protein NrfD